MFSQTGAYQEDLHPVPGDVELSSDASNIAGELVAYDRQHGTSARGGIPQALEDGCTDAQRDAARAYATQLRLTSARIVAAANQAADTDAVRTIRVLAVGATTTAEPGPQASATGPNVTKAQ